MKRPFASLFVLLLAFGLLATPATAEVSRDFSQTYDLSNGGRLSLENINGNVVLEGWDGDEVKVDYTIRARSERGLERVEVVIEAAADRIHIETDYKKRESGWNNDGGTVDFQIWVPRNTRADEIELVNGGLEISGIRGDVKASLVNGTVDARDLAGSVEMESVNGTVNATFDVLENGQSVKLETVNGTVNLKVPASADAEFEASTVHGPIQSDFDFEVEKGRYVGRSLEGVLGSGSAKVELESVNGRINIEEN